jgi:hypothetical protein
VRQLEIDARANPPADVERDEELAVTSPEVHEQAAMGCDNEMLRYDETPTR